MTIAAYIVLTIAAYVFSMWTWNRAVAMGGTVSTEPKNMDLFFALAIAGFVWSLKILL